MNIMLKMAYKGVIQDGPQDGPRQYYLKGDVIVMHVMACYCIISCTQISIGYYICVHYFIWILRL